jgi:hypothetical protein
LSFFIWNAAGEKRQVFANKPSIEFCLQRRAAVWHDSLILRIIFIIMKIATYNVNGVNGRLPVLLRWLEQSKPDVVCLQELKAPEEKFPLAAITEAGYNAHMAWTKELERGGYTGARRDKRSEAGTTRRS